MELRSDKSYIIQNVFNRLVMTIKVDAAESGAPIYSDDWNEATNLQQLWTIKSVSKSTANQVDQNQYSIISVYPARYAFAQDNKASARNHSQSIWSITRQSQGYFSIGEPLSDKVLTCNSEERGSRVILAVYAGESGQLWDFRNSPPPNTNNNTIRSNPSTSTTVPNNSTDLKSKLDMIFQNLQSDPPKCNRLLWKAIETFCVNGNYDDVISMVRTFLSPANNEFVSKGLQVLLYNLEGIKAVKAEKYGLAIEQYGKAINIDQEHSISYANRSEALMLTGQLDSALNDAEKSIKLDPILRLGYHRKGDVLDKLHSSVDGESMKVKTDYSASPINSNEAAQRGPNSNTQSNPSYNPLSDVFFTISIDGLEVGRVVFKLYDDYAPYGAKSFRELAVGVHGFGYKGLHFEQTMPERCFCGGFDEGLFSQGKSIYDPPRSVEIHNKGKAFQPGFLYLANKDTIDSKFVIIMKLSRSPHRFGSPIGEVTEGLDVMKKICSANAQATNITISDCGCVPYS